MGRKFDPNSAWERYSAEESLHTLDYLVDRYVIRFDRWVRDRKGELLVEAAKRPKPATADTSPKIGLLDTGGEFADAETRQRDTKQVGPKRKATQAVHAKWRKAYFHSKKKRPEMPDVWHARRIAESAEGGGQVWTQSGKT